MREKLIELIGKATSACVGTDCFEGCKYYAENDCRYKLMADVLIANGVTVQKWIPVAERMPDIDDLVIAYDIEEDMMCSAIFSGYNWMMSGGYLVDADSFTHWMPLPEPPKGE